MANSEAWSNLQSVGQLLYIQKYAVEELQMLKPHPGLTPEEAQVSKDKINKLFSLFTYNQEKIDVEIDPAHRQVQAKLADRICKKVKSYLTALDLIITPKAVSPAVAEFPSKWTNSTEMADWLTYESYLTLVEDVREFNLLCSSMPHDVLPLLKQFIREGATITEVEQTVNQIRSEADLDSIIETELKKVDKYETFADDPNRDEFEAFVAVAKHAARALAVFEVFEVETEESKGGRVILMVNRITDKFPKVVKDKWTKMLSKYHEISTCQKLRFFLTLPVNEMLEGCECPVGVKKNWQHVIVVVSEIISQVLRKLLTKLMDDFYARLGLS